MSLSSTSFGADPKKMFVESFSFFGTRAEDEDTQLMDLRLTRALLAARSRIFARGLSRFFGHNCSCSDPFLGSAIQKGIDVTASRQHFHLSCYLFLYVQDCCWYFCDGWKLYRENRFRGCTEFCQDPCQTRRRNIDVFLYIQLQNAGIYVVINASFAKRFLKGL